MVAIENVTLLFLVWQTYNNKKRTAHAIAQHPSTASHIFHSTKWYIIVLWRCVTNDLLYVIVVFVVPRRGWIEYETIKISASPITIKMISISENEMSWNKEWAESILSTALFIKKKTNATKLLKLWNKDGTYMFSFVSVHVSENYGHSFVCREKFRELFYRWMLAKRDWFLAIEWQQTVAFF